MTDHNEVNEAGGMLMKFGEDHLKLLRKQLVGGSSPLSGTITLSIDFFINEG